ncbi:FtsX-like permease family protein [Fulvivirga sp. 29W222]|uniref:FtsX-like permease family protein n=1 Tax=Fulvivirga marina TaxID=2494733 RepID=A0A937FZY5_9BACT|nr:ABC transporter permease [Fulvivirga marina]MBL6447563.1 FtsX-like permease family protein [Fulvivirga marina]
MKLFLKLAIRNFFKKPIFNLLNLIGLSIGFISFFYIAEYIIFEVNYDKFNVDSKRIYRVGFNWGEVDEAGDNTSLYASNVPIMGPLLQQEIPEITHYTRLFDVVIARPFSVFTYQEGGEVKYSANEGKGFYADSSFFDIFSFEVLEGDPNLKAPNSLILTSSLAKKMFGNIPYNQMIGKLIEYDNLGEDNLSVEAIIADVPANSHIQFDFLVSYMTIKTNGPHYSKWWSQFHTYIKTTQPLVKGNLDDKMDAVLKLLYGEESTISIFLQPLEEIYLDSDLRAEIGPTGSRRQIYFLSIIAFLVLGMAWINYINLFSFRSSERANEVGIKKVLGSSQKRLIAQFFYESLLFNIVALIISLLFVWVTQSNFENLLNKNLSSVMPDYIGTILMVIVGLIFLSTLPSFYPAWLIAAKRPIDVLGTKFRTSKRNLIFQNTLIYLQFIISFLIITCTLVIERQIDFMKKQDTGMMLTNRISIKSPGNIDSLYFEKASVFVNEIKNNSDVIDASFSSSVPGEHLTTSGGIRLTSRTDVHGNNIFKIDVDENFINTYEIKLLEGRNFSSNISKEKENIIINEAALELLDLSSPSEAINERVIFMKNEYTIIGVISNYNHLSLRESFEPIFFSYNQSPFGYVTLQLDGYNYPNTLSQVKKKYEEIFPLNPFEYELSNAKFNKQYNDIEIFSSLVNIFSWIAIIISGMGLLALSAYKVQKHNKEIAIRKVFGANPQNILLRLFKGLGIEAIISSVIGGCISYMIMKKWLENFAFSVNIRMMDFIIPFIVLLVVIFLSIGYNCIKAVTLNPSKSLKEE